MAKSPELSLEDSLDEYLAAHPNKEPGDTTVADILSSHYEDFDTLSPRKQAELNKALAISLRSRSRQILENADFEERLAATPEEFAQSERTIIKTISEIHVAPADRVVVKRDDLKSRADIEAEIDSLVIDPTMISDNDLEIFGLNEYKSPPRSHLPRRTADKARAIPGLKEELKKLAPVSRPGEKETPGRLRYFRLFSYDGDIVGTRNTPDGDKLFFRTDLNSAERLLAHEESGYREEITELRTVLATLQNIRAELGDWENADLERIKQDFSDLIDDLRFVQAADKKILRDVLQKIKELQDSRERRNPGVIRNAITYKAIPAINNRHAEISSIANYLAEDRTRLEELEVEQKQPIKNFVAQTEAMHERFAILQIGQSLDKETRKKVTTNLTALKTQAEGISFEPYRTFAQEFCRRLEEVVARLDAAEDNPGQRQGAAEEFIKMYLVGKILRTYESLQNVLRMISIHPQIIQPGLIIMEIDNIKAHIATHAVQPEITTPEFDQIFSDIYGHLDDLKALTERYFEDESDREDFEKRYQAIKDAIKSFDFQSKLESLVRAAE